MIFERSRENREIAWKIVPVLDFETAETSGGNIVDIPAIRKSEFVTETV